MENLDKHFEYIKISTVCLISSILYPIIDNISYIGILFVLILCIFRCVKQTGIFHSKPTPFVHLQKSWQSKHKVDLIKASKDKVR